MAHKQLLAVIAAILVVTGTVAGSAATVAAQESPTPESGDPEPPSVPAAYYGNVTIDGEPAPEGTTIEAVVDGEVRGSITINESGQYGGSSNLDPKLSVQAPDNSSNDTVRFFVNNDNIDRTEVTTTDPETVGWEAGDNRRVDLRASVGSPLFEVDIVDAPDSVNAGENAEVTLNITNTGASEGEKTVDVVVGNETRDTVTETLEVGESVERLATVPTAVSDAPSVTVIADTGDDTASTTVGVDRPPEFAVALVLNNTSVVPGEFINGTATVTNVGNQTGTQNVTVTIGDTEITTTELTLDGDASRTVGFSYRTGSGDAGVQTIRATTDDDSNASVARVSEPANFEVDVIDSDSKLDVVANETAVLVADVENVGGARANQTVTVTRDGTELANESFNLSAGEFETVRATSATGADDAEAGGFDLTVASPDDAETVGVTVEDTEAFLDVSIDDVNSSVDEPFPGNTTNVSVDVTVENLGTENVTQDIEFRVDGDERETRSFDADGTLELNDVKVPIRNGEAPGVDLTVASDDDAETEQVGVDGTPEFDVTIVERSNVTQLSPDTPFAPTINVTNVGDQPGDGTLRVRFNDSIERNFSLNSIAAGATNETVEPNEGFAINASTAASRILEAEVVNNGTDATDDVSTRRIAVGDAANFTIESFEPTDTVDQGEQLTLRATINNTGDVNATQTVAVEFEGTTLNATPIELGNVSSGNNTATITADYRTRSADVGDNTVSVGTADNVVEQTVTVRENAAFEVTEVDAPETAIEGEAADTSVTVENVGGTVGNTTTLELFAGGTQVGTRSVTLDAGEVRLVEFDSGEVTGTEPGELDVTAVVPGDDAGTDTIDVGAAGEFEYELTSVADPVTTDGTVEAAISAENVGDGQAQEIVTLAVDGKIVDRTTATAAGGDTTRVTLSNATGSTPGDVTIEVLGPDGLIDTETVTVQEPPEGPDYRVSNVAADASRESNGAILDTNQTVTVTADVTNIGDQDGDQEVSLSVNGTQRDRNASVTLDNGSTTRVSLAFNTSNVTVDGTATVPITVASENRTREGTVTLTEPTPGTASIVATELPSETASQEELFEVNVTIENTGDLDLNETVGIDYRADGSVENTTEVRALGPGNTTTVTLGITPPAEPRAGTFDRTARITVSGASVTRTVPVDFGSIQSGIAAAAVDDTVEVDAGTYRERNEIEADVQGLTIRGVGGTPTVQSPRNADTGLEVTANNVTIENVDFAGDGTGTGVVLDADNTTLLGVDAREWSTGIEETSGTNTIRGSTVRGSGTGILLAGDGGTAIEFVRVTESADRGLVVRADDTSVFGATVLSSTLGIDVPGATGTVIEASTIRGNDDAGIRVADAPGTLESPNPSDNFRTSANILASVVESNGIDAIITNTSVGAERNWWGSPGDPVENVDYVVRSNFTTNASSSRPDSDFRIDSIDVPGTGSGTVARGSAFSVAATVSNDGSKPDLQTVSLTDGGGGVLDTTDVELGAGDQTTVEFSYTPTVSDGNNVDVTVSSLDATSDPATVNIRPADFAVQADGIPSSITEGDTLTVTSTIDNTGGITDTQDIRLLVNGAEADSTSITLAGLSSQSPTLRTTPTANAGATLNVTVVTDDDSVSADVDVTAEGTGDPGDPDTGDSDTGGTDDDTGAASGPIEEIGEPMIVESVTPTVDSETGQSVAAFETTESVRSIAFDTTRDVGEVTVSDLDPETADVEAAPGQAVALQDISVSDEAADTPATIQFRISNDRLDAIGTGAENLRTFRLVDGEWQRLETDVTEETDSGVVLEAQTPGFSVFAVSAVTPPEGAITLTPETVAVGEGATLSGAESTDPDGEIASYEWRVDGETLTGETVTVELDDPGEYTVELVVTDDAGETDTVTRTLVVEAGDTATATAEPDTDTATADPATETPTSTPGFGVVVTLLALLLGAGYAARRNRD